ncbi:hypothetical protein K432DRAFT_73306 [Lepidopterella palustris CBS 459.81]|uniref:Uncharacterized protein n=1 Tax=Lepidopterella palustris CBS 459.81 TaxID=1314670 RepID=A0A8E2EKA9_9PEZI|nr:hypothetical protein K432DRAFT_73306 [Lepidopterella palustris CBS 459.81]
MPSCRSYSSGPSVISIVAPRKPCGPSQQHPNHRHLKHPIVIQPPTKRPQYLTSVLACRVSGASVESLTLGPKMAKGGWFTNTGLREKGHSALRANVPPSKAHSSTTERKGPVLNREAQRTRRRQLGEWTMLHRLKGTNAQRICNAGRSLLMQKEEGRLRFCLRGSEAPPPSHHRRGCHPPPNKSPYT